MSKKNLIKNTIGRHHCGVPKCNAYDGEGISLHRLPKRVAFSREESMKWKIALEMSKEFPERFVICSRHFKESDLISPLNRLPGVEKKMILSKEAFPCLNLPGISKERKMKGRPTKSSNKQRKFIKNCPINTINRVEHLNDPNEVCLETSDNACCSLQTSDEEILVEKDLCDCLCHESRSSSSSSVGNQDIAVPLQLNDFQTVNDDDSKVIKTAHKPMYPNPTVTSCFAPGCISSSDKEHGLQFYGFPHDSALARLWNLQLGSDKTPTKSSRVCDKHFCPDDYTEPGAKDDRQVLKKKAIPSWNIIKKSINPLVKLPEQDIQASSSSLHPKQNLTIGKNDATTQTDKQLVVGNETQTDSEPIPTETILYNELSTDDFYFFTGLVLPNFKELTDYLDIDNKPNKYTIILSNCDQLILTLINLRRRVEMKVVAKMYGIHPDIVRDIFVLWINLMFEQFRKTDLWALRENGELGYTAILHCCEIPCELNNPGLQSILKTRKKKRLSIKYLVATDEQGMVIFCSNQLFSGSIPDQQTIMQSGILAKLTKGDKVLTECDFSSNVIIIHRPDECSDVDKGREYIKRLALMTKKFGILKGVFPANLMHNAAVVVYVTNVLVNFISEETAD